MFEESPHYTKCPLNWILLLKKVQVLPWVPRCYCSYTSQIALQKNNPPAVENLFLHSGAKLFVFAQRFHKSFEIVFTPSIYQCSELRKVLTFLRLKFQVFKLSSTRMWIMAFKLQNISTIRHSSPVYTNNFYVTISMWQFLFARVNEQNWAIFVWQMHLLKSWRVSFWETNKNCHTRKIARV